MTSEKDAAKSQKETRCGPRRAHLSPTNVLEELRIDKMDQYVKALANLKKEQAIQRRLLFQEMMSPKE